MMEGLAFLPDEDIINSIRLLRMLDPNEPPECTDLHDYFDRTNISGTLRRQQKAANHQHARLVIQRNPPMFPASIWIMHEATVNGDTRTNNVCESWNSKFLNNKLPIFIHLET